MGCQLHSNVYVLGPTVQFSSDGTLIPPEEQKYVWVSHVIMKLQISNLIHSLSTLPTLEQPQRRLLDGIVQIMGQNWSDAVLIFLLSCHLYRQCVYTALHCANCRNLDCCTHGKQREDCCTQREDQHNNNYSEGTCEIPTLLLPHAWLYILVAHDLAASQWLHVTHVLHSINYTASRSLAH